MRAALAAAELESFDCDHFDAGLAQRGVGADVALLSDDYAGSERNHIVAIVPARARPRSRPRRSGRSAPGNPPTIWNSTGRCLSETVNMTMAFAIVSLSAVNLGWCEREPAWSRPTGGQWLAVLGLSLVTPVAVGIDTAIQLRRQASVPAKAAAHSKLIPLYRPTSDDALRHQRLRGQPVDHNPLWSAMPSPPKLTPKAGLDEGAGGVYFLCTNVVRHTCAW